MKKITLLLVACCSILITANSFAQKVVVVGMNHATPDGFSFVVALPLGSSEVVYFTEDEYNNTTNVFSSGESVVEYTADPAGLAVGQVVFVKETSTNTFTVTCTNGSTCGSAIATSIPFSIGSGGEHMYAYSDTDSDPTNGVTEIYSVLYTIPGAIPALEDPTPDYATAVVVDGFASGTPDRTEYMFSPASVRDGVSQTNLENPSNYLNGSTNLDLSLVEFTNLNLAGANPVLTLAASPASVAENSGSSIVYTFTLDAPAVGAITVNFSVGGTATFTTDYTETGAATFTTTTGTVTIPDTATMATVTLTPVGDTGLEADETAILSITAGTGYDAGSPSSATGTFDNDDTLAITPVVAVTGTNHTVTDGFSFVALDDIPAGTTVYFTENAFDPSLLTFVGAEAVVSWLSPGVLIPRGEVIVAMETGANTFTVTCSGGTCGTIVVESGTFSLASDGEAFFAYTDTDTDHTNGISEMSAVLYTGVSGTPGGNIPAGEDPSPLYIGSVVADGFAATPPSLTEYDPTLRGVTVDQANFQNTANWVHAAASGTLSTVPFADIIIATGSTNPVATLTVSPTSVAEDSGTGMVYTFMLDALAVGNITINFSVAGTATFTTDYTQTGAATFTPPTGTVVILDGTDSATVTVTPVIDTTVEPTETVELMLASGTGYNGGSPNSATGSITNDDTSASDPIVAVMGISHAGPDGFSFAAAKDIPAGTVVYFTEDEFDNTNLLFSAGESVLQWTSPGGQIDRGDVIVISETTPDFFSVTCSDTSGNGCGAVAVIVGGFAMATDGETVTAYEDNDTDPTNGVMDIYSMMFTGVAGFPGGNLPAIEDPTGIYLNALIVDGFPAVSPVKTEYTPASRAIPVDQANFENPANYDHAFPNPPDLSTVPFADLTIVDTNPPTAICQDITVQLDAAGNATIVAADVDNGSFDAEGPVTLSIDIDTFDCTDVPGPVTVTLTVTDAAGNTATCTSAVTVEDNVAPTAVCQDLTVQLDASGNASITGADVDNGSSDACGIASLSVTPNTFTCANVGANSVTLTVTDNNGNTATCTATVTVEDNIDPEVTCPADITVSNDPGQCDAVVTFSPTATDNCPGLTVAIVPASGSVFPVGTTTVTVTATDPSGNTDVCTFDVTVDDDEDPVVTCPADITVSNDPGQCDAVVTFMASATDNCPGVTTSSIPASGSVFPVGTTTVTVTAMDAAGNTDVCTFDITVDDDEDPVVTCPADITVSNDPGQCDAVVTFMASATDNCPGVTIASVPASGSVFPVGTTTVTVTATDASGNTDVCTFDVTVDDDEDPVATCPADITVSNDPGQCDAVVTFSPTATDNCPGVTVASVPASGSVFPVGTTTVTVTATDASGNTDVCTFDVTVDDDEDPVVTCPADITVSNDPGQCDAVVTFMASATDNCPGVTTSSVPASGSVFPVGTTTVTVTATDAAGNTDVCTFDITVDDDEDPVVTCPADITVSNDPGQCNAVVTFSPTATDNCPGVTTSSVPASGSVFPVGTTTVTVTATDASGNTDICTFDVTVNDTEPPMALCQDITIQLDANGDASITPADVDAGSTDNCGIASLAIDIDTFDCSDVGPNNVTLTVTDVNGNVSMCVAIVTVEDNVPPVAICVDITVDLDANGNAMITPADVDGGSNDACGIASLAIDIDTFDCSDVGPNNVTLTVTDVNGNVSMCVAIVTIQDVTPPTIACPADVFTSTDPDICGAQVFFADALALDACGVASVVQTMGAPSGSIFPVGVTTIEYTATDVNGNTNTCTFTITVEDLTPPNAVCQDITIQLDANGNAMITAADVDGGSFDNCGVITNLSIDIDTFDCSDVGPNPVVLSVTDDNGNTGTCTAIVTVEDVTPPDAVCMDITVQLDAAGTVTIAAIDVDGGSTDACGIDTFSLDIDTFICADVGPNTVTLTVTDVNGNSATCTAVVTVEDVTPPVITCMDIEVGLDQDGLATIVPADILVSATDACGVGTAALDIFEFSCDDIGTPVTVQLFVVDINGNVSSCTAVVTVKDGMDPILTCPADFTVEVEEGTSYTVPDFIADGTVTVTDNCTDPVTNTTQDPAVGTVLPEGVYTVTMTAEDDSSNGATCTFELTVVGVLGADDNTFDISTIVMYPNPATTKVHISNPQNILLDEALFFDLTGRLVGTYNLKDMGTDIGLDISHLATATYTVVIKGPSGKLTKRLVKE